MKLVSQAEIAGLAGVSRQAVRKRIASRGIEPVATTLAGRPLFTAAQAAEIRRPGTRTAVTTFQ
jgi:hypothetical protein